MSAAQGDVGAEGLDLDAIEEHARAVKAFVNDDGDELPEDVDGLLTVLGATEVMADDLADTVPSLVAEVRRLRALLAPVQKAARKRMAAQRAFDAGAWGVTPTEDDDLIAAALATIADEKDGAQ